MPKGPVQIAPSLLSADFSRLGEEALGVLQAGAEVLHVDTMDGHFVPNLTFGAPIVKALRPLTEATIDCHLMVSNPDDRIAEFLDAGADIITVHAEVAHHLQRTLSVIREGGAKAGVALNPHTPLSVVEHVIDDVDLILCMTVNPGFGGQAFLPAVEAASALIERSGRDILLEVDGGIAPDTAPIVRKAGANVLVAGTAIFKADEPLADRIARLRGDR